MNELAAKLHMDPFELRMKNIVKEGDVMPAYYGQVNTSCALNLKLCNLTDRARVVAGDSMEFLKSVREKYDLVFLDPPYQTDLLETAIAHIARHDLLSVHGMMIAEHPVDKALPALSAPYRMACVLH